MTRSMMNQMGNPEASKLKFAVFLKCVLDFQLREHEKFLGFFVQVFKGADVDRDGILNENEFRSMMMNLGFNQDGLGSDFQARRIEKFLQDIDPYSNQKITFSECVQLLSSETVTISRGDPYGNGQLDDLNTDDMGASDSIQMAILEFLSQNNPVQMPNTSTQSQASGLSTPAMSNR